MTKLFFYLRTRYVCTSIKFGIFCIHKWQDGCCWRPPKRHYGICCCSLSITISCSISHRKFALVSCETNKYACVEQNAKHWKGKQHQRIFRSWIRLLCTWHLIECTVYLLATSRLSPTYTRELSGSPGPASLHTRLGKQTQIKQS